MLVINSTTCLIINGRAVRIEQCRAIFRVSLRNRRKKYPGITNAREEGGQARAIGQSSLAPRAFLLGLTLQLFHRIEIQTFYRCYRRKLNLLLLIRRYYF